MDERNNGGYYGNQDGQTPEQQQRQAEQMLAATSAMGHAGFGMNGGAGFAQPQGYAPGVPGAGDTITVQRYNMTIGAMLLYGFLVNAIMCFVFGDRIMSFAKEGLPVIVISYFVGSILGMVVCNKTENPVVGFIGYNLIVVPMGLFLTPLFSMFEFSTVRFAFCIMCVVTLVVIGLSYAYPQFFLSMGRTLLTLLVLGIVSELVLWLLGYSSGIFDFVFIAIFCGYIGYDWAIAQKQQKTTPNAIRCAYMMYVDMINLLIRLLRILAKNRD
ncbi:MAG: Bax inhibitor-1 family protein [Lachnospiraceae bacterium]|nr:Bax inhibitor-1 family protein [Lachnospiraceae bacterium]